MVFTEMKESDPEKGQSGLSDSVVPGFKADAKQSSPEDIVQYADPGMIGWRITKHAIVPAVSLGAAILMLTGPGRTVARGEAADSQGEIQKVFPMVMELVLLLQTNNVFMSVEATRDRAPVILREPLRQLLSEMQAAPVLFIRICISWMTLICRMLKTAMRMLYAMDETGTGNAEIQMNALIKRNNILLDKAERIQNEDRLAGTGMLVYLPMVTGTVKMMVDMIFADYCPDCEDWKFDLVKEDEGGRLVREVLMNMEAWYPRR